MINHLLKVLGFYYRTPDVRYYYYSPGVFGGFSVKWHPKVIGYYTEIKGCTTVVLHLNGKVTEMGRTDAIKLLKREGNKH